MKTRKHFSRWIKVGGLLLIGLLATLVGPPIIHSIYKACTPSGVIEANRAEYQRLANTEASLGASERMVSIHAREALFLWFHARGLNIDEDDEPTSIWHPWEEIFQYWQM